MTPTKCCTGCKVVLPATQAHFAPAALGKYGLAAKCRECKRAQGRTHYAANLDSERARTAAARQRDPEIKNARARASKDKNRERVREVNRAWKAANRDAIRAYNATRRALLCKANGQYTAEEWQATLTAHAGCCHWCKRPITGTPHADHVIPLSKGGANTIENIVPACATCNSRKSHLMPEQFIKRYNLRL